MKMPFTFSTEPRYRMEFFMNGDEEWNAAILEVLKIVEGDRDQAYKAERHAKKGGLNGLPSGYRADGLRDAAIEIRKLLRIEHFPPQSVT